MNVQEIFSGLWQSTGIAQLFIGGFKWQNVVMIGLSFLLLYFAVFHKCEPLLLVPIAFGMLLANLPGVDLLNDPAGLFGHGTAGGHWYETGLLQIFYAGVKSSLFPCLIFLGVGAMTDFGPLLARPSSLLLGAAAQLGIVLAFLFAILLGFSPKEAAAIGIIGSADGPTTILITTRLAPHLMSSVTIAAYSYMALIPFIQPPIMRALTTKQERVIRMDQTRTVSKLERILFPVIVLVLVVFLLPGISSLLGMLMLGNLLRECGVTDRLSETAQNAMMNTVCLMLGLSVGAQTTGESFLKVETLGIFLLGIVAFGMSTAGGVMFGKLMNKVTHGKVNPLIGAAGVSAMPMAARVAQKEGAKHAPGNHLLMHAMGPNVAGVIGSAVLAGIFLTIFEKLS